LTVLVVDPSFQRRGIGSILVSDGVARAHAQSLPVILSASPMGAHLYTSLGFETKDTPVLECAGFSMPVMVSEPA
jgi:ribosomal protein S18 acetylase RimI-like enzyme